MTDELRGRLGAWGAGPGTGIEAQLAGKMQAWLGFPE